DKVSANVHVPPSFSEFWDIFQQQNPKSRLLSGHADSEERNSQRKRYSCYTERSLRRSLKRLGYALRFVKRGPKERGQAKEDDDEFVVTNMSLDAVVRYLANGEWTVKRGRKRRIRDPKPRLAR